ncbi:MAG: FHA domain-containing protein [Flavisolibacter sp.]
MFDLFKQNENNTTQDVKMLRHKLLQFIKEQLQRWEGGEGNAIKGMQLFLAPEESEKGLYDGVIWSGEPGRLQDEVQRIADDYSIELPENWTMETAYVDELPKDGIKALHLPVSLFVATRKQPTLTRATTAYINVLGGVADQPHYTITSTSGKICIGRDKKSQTADGFMRENNIAFPGELHESNKYVSRQHAHIEWNKEAGGFYLFADEGGLPPRNKIKVRTADGHLIKLQTQEVGHELQEGDQIVLGESALLQFTYLNEQ